MHLDKVNTSSVQKYEFEAYSTKSNFGNYEHTLPEGTEVKVLSIVTVYYGLNFYSTKARIEYINPQNKQKINFEINLDSLEKEPFILKNEIKEKSITNGSN